MSTRLSTSAAPSLQTDGYCRFQLRDTVGGLGRLQAAVDRLPADPYAPAANRHRRYSNGVLLPWSRQIQWMPTREGAHGPYSEYYQGDYNSEYLSMTRRFVPFEDEVLHDPFLSEIIWNDFDLTFWDEAQLIRPFVVGVHLVRLLVSRPGDQAISSPNHLHQDGEPFTFVHLLVRENAVGCTTAVAEPGCVGKKPEDVDAAIIHTQFELRQPLESYGVCDPKVAHYVSALHRGPEDRPAVRAALLTDFTPLVPLI
ncbi:MAG TPA: 2OG-Fe dioxygenase family protein [Candidatus Eisenbacteria bacterium]|nr:2OG-Fe dioxygenase family protein [Candidatus Eisenbacteria bacterium]